MKTAEDVQAYKELITMAARTQGDNAGAQSARIPSNFAKVGLNIADLEKHRVTAIKCYENSGGYHNYLMSILFNRQADRTLFESINNFGNRPLGGDGGDALAFKYHAFLELALECKADDGFLYLWNLSESAAKYYGMIYNAYDRHNSGDPESKAYCISFLNLCKNEAGLNLFLSGGDVDAYGSLRGLISTENEDFFLDLVSSEDLDAGVKQRIFPSLLNLAIANSDDGIRFLDKIISRKLPIGEVAPHIKNLRESIDKVKSDAIKQVTLFKLNYLENKLMEVGIPTAPIMNSRAVGGRAATGGAGGSASASRAPISELAEVGKDLLASTLSGGRHTGSERHSVSGRRSSFMTPSTAEVAAGGRNGADGAPISSVARNLLSEFSSSPKDFSSSPKDRSDSPRAAALAEKLNRFSLPRSSLPRSSLPKSSIVPSPQKSTLQTPDGRGGK